MATGFMRWVLALIWLEQLYSSSAAAFSRTARTRFVPRQLCTTPYSKHHPAVWSCQRGSVRPTTSRNAVSMISSTNLHSKSTGQLTRPRPSLQNLGPLSPFFGLRRRTPDTKRTLSLTTIGATLAMESGEEQGCDLTEKEKDRNYLLLTVLYFCKIFSNILVITTGPIIATKHFNGNTPSALDTLNLVASLAAAMEFVVNPFWGGFSDQIGRKFFLVGSSFITGLGYLLVASSPNLWVFIAVRLILNMLPLFSTFYATLADMYADNSGVYAKKTARIQSWSGVGVVLASAIGGYMSTISLRLPYAVSGIITSLSVLIALNVKETHGQCKRKPMSLKKLNPFSFISLFSHGSLFTRLNLITMLQTIRLYMGDVFQIFLREVLAWTPAMIGNVYSLLGLITITGGFVAGSLIRMLGAFGLAFWSTSLVTAAFITYGFVDTQALFFVALALGAPGTICSLTPNSLVVKMAGEKGINFGELTSARNNLYAITRVITPLVCSKLYGLGYKLNSPGLPFLVVGGFIGFANLLLLSTRNSDIWKNFSNSSTTTTTPPSPTTDTNNTSLDADKK
eukprot:jgi/Bigna1/72365/fgenesh1_pg.19_\